MKKLFIFTIFIICAILQVSCKSQKEQKTEDSSWAYECTTIVYWSDQKGMSGRGLDLKNYSTAKTMNTAIAETVDLTKKQFPKAKDHGIYIKCEGNGEVGYFGKDPCHTDQFRYRTCPDTLLIPSDSESRVKPTPESVRRSRSITFGCRARVQTNEGSTRSIYHNSTAKTHDLAVEEVRDTYKQKYPGTTNFESNCWPCDLPRLDERGQIVCEQHTG